METNEKTDNELIAEFIGLEVVKYNTHFAEVLAIVPEDGCVDWPDLRIFSPNTDWNHLMPVVEKIEYVIDGHATISKNHCNIQDKTAFSITGLIYGETKIKATYKAVIVFIKWYNANKK